MALSASSLTATPRRRSSGDELCANTSARTASAVAPTGSSPRISPSRSARRRASLFQRGDYRHRVVIGKDTRLSGYMIEKALVAGFTSVGMDVLLLGPMPTPAVAMLTRSMRADLGVMISASHNPLRGQRHQALRPGRLQALRRGRARDRSAHRRATLGRRLAAPAELGRAKRIDERRRPATSSSPSAPCRGSSSLDGMRVVLDCANGAAYKVAPEALWELGAEVIAHRRRARRLQHQQGGRLDRAGGADPQGPRVARRYRHRPRRRRRPRGHRRRKGPAWSTATSSWRVVAAILARGRPPVAGRHRRDGDVQSRPRALSRRSRPHARAHRGRRPLRARAHARARLQSRRRAVGPHHPVRLHDDRRRARRRAAAPRRREAARASRSSEVCHRFEPLPQILKNVRYKAGQPLQQDTVVHGDRERPPAARRPAGGSSSAPPAPSRSSA